VTFRFAIALALLLPEAALAQARLTVGEAVTEALRTSAQVKAARARADGAADSARSLRGRMLPSVFLSDEQQHYREPWSVDFALDLPGMPPLSLPARNVNTNTFVVSARQPVLGLLHLSQDYVALASSGEGAEANVRAAEAAVREEVETGFLRIFEARALAATARAAVQQLGEQVEVMKSKLKIGVATNADVLRLQVAVANARQQEIQANAQEKVSRSALLAALGRSVDDASTDFEEPTELEADGASVRPLSEALESAMARRPEIMAVSLQAQAASQHTRAKLLELLPELNLEAAYIHVHGEVLAPADSTYVGIKAEWLAWEWGAKYYEGRNAADQAAAARAELDGLRRRVGAEVAARRAQADAALSAVDVARSVIDSAEEAYRVTDELMKVGSATTTDLLDAQSALTQARLNLVRARYEHAIARVALARATGE
jgi:outer membrane protein TolC